MKRNNFLKNSLFLVAATLLFATIFSACKKNDPVRTPMAGLKAFNLIPDLEGIGFAVDNNSISNTPFSYTTLTPGYINIFPGNRQFSSFNFSNSQVLATESFSVKDSSYYSLFAVGTEGDYKNVIVEDPINDLDATSGKAFVRYVNGVTGADAAVTVTENGNTLFDATNETGFVSGFKEATPGKITVSFHVNDENEPVEREIDLSENGVYVILILGEAQTSGDAQPLEIKMAQYGTVTP